MTFYTDNDALRAAILRVMQDGSERTAPQIAKALDTTTSRMRYTLQRLVQEGILQRKGGGSSRLFRMEETVSLQ